MGLNVTIISKIQAMLVKISIFSILVSLLVISTGLFDEALAQIQNLDCPNCITIPKDKIELYKTLSPILIWTDHTKYNHNSVITVTGWLKDNFLNQPITVKVFNPIGNVVRIDQVSADAQGNFKFTFNTAGSLWNKDGFYIISAQHGPESRVFKTKVELISIDSGVVNQCAINEIRVVAENGGIYCIRYASQSPITFIDGDLSVTKKTLTITPKGYGTGTFTLDIPRNVLDSKEGGNDSDFVVMINGKPGPYTELESSDPTKRKLEFQVYAGSKITIEIIGTNVVPEFGALTAMILLLAILPLVVLRKKGLQLFNRF